MLLLYDFGEGGNCMSQMKLADKGPPGNNALLSDHRGRQGVRNDFDGLSANFRKRRDAKPQGLRRLKRGAMSAWLLIIPVTYN